MSFKAIGFDYSGVIAGQPSYVFEKDLSKLLGVEVAIFKKAYFKYNVDLNSNKMSAEDFWKRVLGDCGKIDKLDSVWDFLKNKPSSKINEKMIELVDGLRDKGYRVGLLTNRSLESAARLRKMGIDRHFDTMVVSSEIGYSKPEPQAFKLLAKNLKAKLRELIFVDDAKESLSSAKKLGIYPILFRNYESFLKDLSQLISI